MKKPNIICWADGNRCFGCPHWDGKAPTCSYRPPTISGRLIFWFSGRCSFRNIFVGCAEAHRIAAPKTPDEIV